MRILVLAAEPVSAQELRDALPAELDPTQGEVMVVAPALQENPIKFWLSDADDAIARAQQVQQESVEQLRGEGVSASGDTGEADPLAAIQDALTTFEADRIVLFTRGEEGRYREDVDPEEVSQRFGIPAERAGG